jgi:hypothetical protein
MATSSNGWTAGVVHHGPPATPRSETPLSRLRMTRTEYTATDNHYATAQEAFDSRVKRLREMGDTFTTDGLTIRYRDDRGTDGELTYEEA